MLIVDSAKHVLTIQTYQFLAYRSIGKWDFDESTPMVKVYEKYSCFTFNWFIFHLLQILNYFNSLFIYIYIYIDIYNKINFLVYYVTSNKIFILSFSIFFVWLVVILLIFCVILLWDSGKEFNTFSQEDACFSGRCNFILCVAYFNRGRLTWN